MRRTEEVPMTEPGGREDRIESAVVTGAKAEAEAKAKAE